MSGANREHLLGFRLCGTRGARGFALWRNLARPLPLSHARVSALCFDTRAQRQSDFSSKHSLPSSLAPKGMS